MNDRVRDEAPPDTDVLASDSAPADSPRTGDPEAPSSGDLGTEHIVSHTKRYHVVERIGEGGMGWIYRAHDPVLDRFVAIKLRKPNIPPAERDRFRREAIYGARFNYPAMVRVYDLVEDPSTDACWFAMEYLPGRDMERILERVLASGRMMPLPLLGDVFRQILAALQYSHDCGIVHRDIKPSNMFVTRDPNTRFVTAKLLDFGVAFDLRRDPSPDHIVGDPAYIAPEQTYAGAVVDGRADIYAAGISLFRVVTGRHPFADLFECPPREFFEAHRERQPPVLSSYLPHDTSVELAHGLDEVFERATAKRPEDRYACAGDMQAALLDVLDAHAATQS